jgi:hypothetical protein
MVLVGLRAVLSWPYRCVTFFVVVVMEQWRRSVSLSFCPLFARASSPQLHLFNIPNPQGANPP